MQKTIRYSRDIESIYIGSKQQWIQENILRAQTPEIWNWMPEAKGEVRQRENSSQACGVT